MHVPNIVFAVVLAVWSVLNPCPVRAGGADMEAGIGNPDLGPPYFGEARDVNGLTPVEGVRIRAKAKGSLLPVFVATDHDGRFRLQGFAKEIDPATVEFTCDMEGYDVVSLTTRRMFEAPDAPTEVECLLEKK